MEELKVHTNLDTTSMRQQMRCTELDPSQNPDNNPPLWLVGDPQEYHRQESNA
jgi:hypothetical protein